MEIKRRWQVRASRRASILTWAIIAFVLQSWPAQARAEVSVIANRTGAEIRFTVSEAVKSNGEAITASTAKFDDSSLKSGSQPVAYSVAAGDLAIVRLHGSETARLTTSSVTYALEPDAAYYFGSSPSGKVDLARIGIDGMPTADQIASLPVAAPNRAPATAESEEAARTITVKLVGDADDPAARAVWEHRWRERLAAASEILDHTCGMKLKIVAVGTWHCPAAASDFDSAANEFVRTVNPGEARLAIGFTGRYTTPSGACTWGAPKGRWRIIFFCVNGRGISANRNVWNLCCMNWGIFWGRCTALRATR